MSTIHTPSTAWAELPEVTRQDRAHFVTEARRLRAAQFDRVFAAIGRGLARLGHTLLSPFTRSGVSTAGTR